MIRVFFAAMLIGLLTATAGTPWPALDPAVWSIRPDQYPNQPTGLVLLDHYHFHRKSIERFRRVLVLNEAGRSHADAQLGGAKIGQLEGRTLFPDGRVQPFVQGKDVVKLEASVGRRELGMAHRVFPPGVTPHCIVDLHWFEAIDEPDQWPLPSAYGYNLLLSLSAEIPVKRAELYFDSDLSDRGWMKKIEVEPGQKRTEGYKDGLEVIIFDDIPARQRVPLASRADTLKPLFNWFWAPPVRDWLTFLGAPPDKAVSVLDAIAQTYYYQWLMDPLEKERALKGELQALVNEVPPGADAHARALALVRLLRTRVHTLGELEDQPDRKSWKAELSKVLARRWGTSGQIIQLGFLLLTEARLNPVLALALDREESRVIDGSNIWQYDESLLGVRNEQGQWLHLDPSSTFDALRVPCWVQGGRALHVIPAAKRLEWRMAFVDLPVVDPEKNGAIWKVRLVPGEEADSYSASLSATGSMASSWKRRVQAQKVPEPKKALTPILEQGRFHLNSATGESLTDPWKEFEIAFDGALEHDGGRHRAIKPFPFLDMPFPIPTAWPESRKIGIHLPMSCRIQAECRIAWNGPLPEEGVGPMARENYFGKVAWTAALEGQGPNQELVVRLDLTVSRPVGSGYQQEQLKAFTGWIQEAISRVIPVPRG